MKTISIALFLCFLTFELAYSTSPNFLPDSSAYEQSLNNGIQAFYKTNWREAEAIFDDLQEKYPKDSRAYFFSSMIPFWEYYFGENTKQAAHLFLSRSQKAISVSLDELKENPHDTTMVLLLSGLYGYRSLIAASEKQYRTAIQSGMTGFKYTRQLLALHVADSRALIGKGIFFYMMGSIPRELKWMTNMAGLSANKQEGLNLLILAAESRSYVSNDAKMILAYLYEKENRNEKALHQLQKLSKSYPQNIIFQYNLARLLEKCNQLTEAKAKYKEVASLKGDELQILKEKSRKRIRNL